MDRVRQGKVLTIPEQIREHLDKMPVVEHSDDHKHEWWDRAFELRDEARAAGYETEGDPDDDW